VKVAAIKAAPSEKVPTAGFVMFADGIEAWTPEVAKLEPLVGKDLPPDWTLRDGPRGKQLLPPKQGGGGPAAFRNTKEGFLAEQAGRQRWQEIEEDCRDRRTALMQAVEDTKDKIGGDWQARADEMYRWLKASGGAVSGERVSFGEGASNRPEATPPGNTSPPQGSRQPPPGGDPTPEPATSSGLERTAAKPGGASVEASGDDAPLGEAPPGAAGNVLANLHFHGPWTDLTPTGQPLPKGRWRCLGKLANGNLCNHTERQSVIPENDRTPGVV
jgi:hypothetical protein